MTMGVREMARALGCAPSLVSRYKGSGMPLASVDAARAWLRDNVRPDPRSSLAEGASASPPAPSRIEVPDYRDARARREQAEAELAELKLREQRGELVRVEKIRATHQRRVAAMRETFLQLPARVVPLLHADSSPEALDRVLKREIATALRQVTEVD